jgi:hypothetical protein
MYLENIILQVTNTNTWKISPKSVFQWWFAQKNKGDVHPINLNWARHLGTRSMSSPEPTVWSRWLLEPVMEWPLPRASRSLPGASRPLLQMAVTWHHAEVVETRLHAKYRCTHRLTPPIKGGLPLLILHHHKAKSFSTFEQHSKGLGPSS